MKHLNLALIAGGALLATPAFADDQTEPAAGGTEAGAGGEVSTGGAGAGMEGTVNATATADTGAWPTAVIDRPYVLPKSKLAVGADLGVAKISFPDGMGGSTTSTGEGLGIIAGYGVTDKITAGLTYGFSLNEFEIKGPLSLYGEFQLAHSAKMSITASANFTYDLNSEAKEIDAGLGLRYNVTP